MNQLVVEEYEHDACPACGAESLPAEGISDQSFRVCSEPLCEKEFFEDLSKPVRHSKFIQHVNETIVDSAKR